MCSYRGLFCGHISTRSVFFFAVFVFLFFFVEKQGKIEKYIMRKAFDTPEDPYLPQHILYRQKEQFSDGVGYNWIDELREKAEQEVRQRLGLRQV